MWYNQYCKINKDTYSNYIYIFQMGDNNSVNGVLCVVNILHKTNRARRYILANLGCYSSGEEGSLLNC